MAEKKQCVAMLLAGGQGSRLGALTRNTAKPAVPFGGKYRIIDFPLSNCANSGIDVVGVLTQYQPLELNKYIGNGKPWDLDRLHGGVFVLPPYTMAGESGSWYRGTANAIYQNISFIEQYDPEYVLILSGDHIYTMDYSQMIAVHRRQEADCTIAVIEVPWEEAPRFGIITTDQDGTITKFTEKPKKPDSNLASMGIYVFSWKVLREYLMRDEADPTSSNDFGKNIIPTMLKDKKRMTAYSFRGYWKDVGTIDSLWEANMDLITTPPRFNLYDPQLRIYGRNALKAPHYVGENAQIESSMFSEGAVVEGIVRHSIIFTGVTVEEGAIVEDSVIMNETVIRRGCQIRRAIVSEDCVIGAGSVIGGDGSIALVGNQVNLPAGSVVKAGEQIDNTDERKG